jgi:hypothetical protein
MRRRTRHILPLFLVMLCACATRAATSEQGGISSFRVDVRVQDDATLEVCEEIVLDPAGKYYRHGFIRNLPIGSEDRWDPNYVGEYRRDNGIRVKVIEVTADGSPIKYEQGQAWGYSQLRIGEKDVPLSAGQHRYVIRYTVNGVLLLDPKHDTLYWNALGHERDVPVAEAILSVHLPPGVPDSSVAASPRIGGRGVSSPRRAEAELDRVSEPGSVTYRATHIGPRQSLSLAVVWPSGYLHAPRFNFLGPEPWLLAAPCLLFLYYLIAWLRIGPEPKPGALVTQYEPPQGLSAAAVRYVVTTGSDGRSFAAVIAELAARECLRAEPKNEKYKLSRMMSDRATEAKLAPEEQRILAMLFEDGPTIELTPALDQRNTAQNSRYVFAIQQELSKRLDGLYFTKHAGIIALGVLATFLCALLFAARASGRDTSGALFFTVWALGAGLMIGLLFEMAFWPACKTALHSGGGWIKLLPGTAAIGAFVWVIVYMLEKLAEDVSLAFALMLAGLMLVNLVWGPRLKRRTVLGRQMLDLIAGFRLFLEKVEKDRLDKLNSAGEAPELLDVHLSYAIALEIREAWGDHLAQTFLATSVMR